MKIDDTPLSQAIAAELALPGMLGMLREERAANCRLKKAAIDYMDAHPPKGCDGYWATLYTLAYGHAPEEIQEEK